MGGVGLKMHLAVKNGWFGSGWQDGDDVDHTHHAPHIFTSIGRRVESQNILNGEDHHTSSVKAEEYQFVPVPAGQSLARLARFRPAAHRLDNVRHDGDGDEETGHVVKHQRRRRSVRILKLGPHAFAQRDVRNRHLNKAHYHLPEHDASAMGQ